MGGKEEISLHVKLKAGSSHSGEVVTARLDGLDEEAAGS